MSKATTSAITDATNKSLESRGGDLSVFLESGDISPSRRILFSHNQLLQHEKAGIARSSVSELACSQLHKPLLIPPRPRSRRAASPRGSSGPRPGRAGGQR